MTAPLNFIAQHADQLIDNGYQIIPIQPNTKRPGLYGPRGWQLLSGWNSLSDRAREGVLGSAKSAIAAGVGIVTGEVVAIDIDVLDAGAAGRAALIIIEHLGETPAVRVGKEPKILLVYRTENPFSKIVMTPIECLARGQQFVAYGVHPETGRPYQWPNDSLADVPVARLPLVKEAQVRAAMEAAYASLPPELQKPRIGLKSKDEPRADHTTPHNPNEDKRGTPEACGECLRRIPNEQDIDWNTWNRIGAALYNSSSGEKWGFDLFDEFSRRSPKYCRDEEETPATRWRSWHRSPMTEVGYGTLWHIATQFDDAPFPSDIAFNNHKKAAAEMDITVLLNGHRSPASIRPEPLVRASSIPSAYPVDALGPTLAAAAKAIADVVQCPVGIAAQSVLGAASLATQPHGDVVIPATGHAKPIGLFLLTIAESGERKSAADSEALAAVRKHEKTLRRTYDKEMRAYLKDRSEYEKALSQAQKKKGEERKSALAGVPPEPKLPISPVLTCEEPTLEGLQRLYMCGLPSLGIFSDEGGTFINGHGMSNENRLRTVAGFSKFWDGSAITRVRSGDGAVILDGRRLCMHVLAQPDAASRLLSDNVLKDQGFLSRILVSAPESTAGSRFQRAPDPDSRPALETYGARLLSILELPLPLDLCAENELAPRRLGLTEDAKAAWRSYANRAEGELARGRRYEPIKGLANKLPEHACRLAAVITLFEDISATQIELWAMEAAVRLADYYADEALRLFGAGSISPEILVAEQLRRFLQDRWTEERVSVRALVRFGPNDLRDSKSIRVAIKVLEDHHWLLDCAPADVRGQRSKKTWRVVREIDE